ncbi:MAG: hypothetical protein AB7S38_10345 [Vulcanimicrobiota bacterium]
MTRQRSASRPICGPRTTAFTLAEVLVAAAVASLLLSAIFFIYRTSASAWMKGDTVTQLRNQTMIASGKISRDLERSIYSSLSLSPDGKAIAFLSATDANGRFQYDVGNESPRWQNYLIYYLDVDSKLKLRRVSVVGSPQETGPTVIDGFGPNQPVSTYTNGGELVADEIAECQFSSELLANGNHLLRLRLRASQQRYGSERPESFELESVTYLRNQ